MSTDGLDPIARFISSFARAKASAGPEGTASAHPTTVTLASADARGFPSARIVLLKSVDERGFVFHTNRLSRKGRELTENPRCALCFLWPALAEQVRVEGVATILPDDESDAYFASRPRDSQIGAWASRQSQHLESRDELLASIREVEARFEGKAVPRPGHWGGYRVEPGRIEFWVEEKFRIHKRDLYTRHTDGTWTQQLLFP